MFTSKFVPVSSLFTMSTSLKHVDYKGIVDMYDHCNDEIVAAWDIYTEMLENHTNGSDEGEELIKYILDCLAFGEYVKEYAHREMWEYYNPDFRKVLVPVLNPMPF